MAKIQTTLMAMVASACLERHIVCGKFIAAGFKPGVATTNQPVTIAHMIQRLQILLHRK